MMQVIHEIIVPFNLRRKDGTNQVIHASIKNTMEEIRIFDPKTGMAINESEFNYHDYKPDYVKESVLEVIRSIYYTRCNQINPIMTISNTTGKSINS